MLFLFQILYFDHSLFSYLAAIQLFKTKLKILNLSIKYTIFQIQLMKLSQSNFGIFFFERFAFSWIPALKLSLVGWFFGKSSNLEAIVKFFIPVIIETRKICAVLFRTEMISIKILYL